MSRILILGASGLLGKRIWTRLSSKYDVLGTSHTSNWAAEKASTMASLDALNESATSALFESLRPDVVINCIGLTSVDECERRPETAWLLNALVASKVASLSAKFSSKLIHISTDHFESIRQVRRKEDENLFAINQYGLTKLTAETMVLAHNPKTTIIRTNFFGIGKKGGNSILDFAVQSLSSGVETLGATDIFFTPIGAESLVDFIEDFVDQPSLGIINIAGKDELTKFEFIELVATLTNASRSLIKAVTSTRLNLHARRPTYLSLDTSKAHALLGFQSQGIEQMLRRELDMGKSKQI